MKVIQYNILNRDLMGHITRECVRGHQLFDGLAVRKIRHQFYQVDDIKSGLRVFHLRAYNYSDCEGKVKTHPIYKEYLTFKKTSMYDELIKRYDAEA